jgi:hypothetical protein
MQFSIDTTSDWYHYNYNCTTSNGHYARLIDCIKLADGSTASIVIVGYQHSINKRFIQYESIMLVNSDLMEINSDGTIKSYIKVVLNTIPIKAGDICIVAKTADTTPVLATFVKMKGRFFVAIPNGESESDWEFLLPIVLS